MSTQYEIYLKSVTQLVATLVIKDEITCEVINSSLTRLGQEIDPSAPATWKYYLNLAGKYHRTNVPMTVVSMDDQTTIDFTVENMQIHRRTWREYRYGSRFYNELVEQYPDNEMLINGILNPVPIQTAIAAADHSILYYDPSLVEGRETNLIPKLQFWIDGQFNRWANDDFRINNPLFVAARLLNIFGGMTPEILNIRKENCLTPYAHSYHVRRYLASFGPLDAYYDRMTEFQRLWFYFNIRYLMRNNGQQKIFETLTKNVMTHRNLPLADYTMQQNDENIVETLDPATQFMRRSINGIPSALGEDIKSTREILTLQTSLARNNLSEQPYAEIYVPAAMERDPNAEANTKILESNVLDMTESEPYTLSEILLNHWIYLADQGRYTAVITLTPPTGGEPIRLSARDAWIVYQYLYMLRSGTEMITIPQDFAKRVRRIPLPTYEELRSITTKEFVPDAFIREALRDNVDITGYVSVDGFNAACRAIHKRMLLHRDLYLYRDNLYQYGEIRTMTDRFYADVGVDMDQGQNYAAWLAQRNLSFEGYTLAQIDELLKAIISQATGADLRVTQTLKDIHQAMVGIMSQLSSYTVHYITQINDEAVLMFDWPHLRYHPLGGQGADHGQMEISKVTALELSGKGKTQWNIPTSKVGISDFESFTYHHQEMTIGLTFDVVSKEENIPAAIILGPTVSALSIPEVDLATLLTGQTIKPYPAIETRPISELFNKVTTNDFTAP